MKIIKIAIAVIILFSANSTSTLAQVVVTKRVVVKSVNPQHTKQGYIWVAPHWKWQVATKRYVQVQGYWLKRRPGYRYVAGYWKGNRNSRWVPGRWIRA